MRFFRVFFACTVLLSVSVLVASEKPDIISVESEAKVTSADMMFFTDSSCSQLKPEISNDVLDKIKSSLLKDIAANILDGRYKPEYRVAEYTAYASPKVLSETLKLGDGFSKYENITGMYLETGENVMFVGDTGGKEISLLIPELMRKPAEDVTPSKDPKGWGLYKQRVKLKEGLNKIIVQKPGNAYISYFDDDPENAPAVKVHFATGKINGYFDTAKDNDEDWNRLLDNAVSPIMDARGRFIQVAYPVEWLKEFAYGRGVELINNYDTLLRHQYELMGLVKYHKLPQNRVLARVNFNYYMFRDGDGVAYYGDKNTMRMVAHPEVVIVGDPCWGFSHEVGHVLQMNPQMTWGGMTEVSNNIHTLYVTTRMGNNSRLKAGGSYQKARESIIEAEPKISYLHDGDVFNRLVPFWQLFLYFENNGKPDFYADVMEQMRLRPDAGRGNDSIKNQFEFVKICCDVSKLDLTDFFEKWGFFWTGEIELNDYAKYKYTITQEMVDDTTEYVKSRGYPKPETDITLVQDDD
jgi:hypothetical protein